MGGREGKVKRNGELSPALPSELKADVKRLAWQKLQVTITSLVKEVIFNYTHSQAIFTDYQLDKLSRDKAMKGVYTEVIRQVKLSHPSVDGEMMNNALQEVIHHRIVL